MQPLSLNIFMTYSQEQCFCVILTYHYFPTFHFGKLCVFGVFSFFLTISTDFSSKTLWDIFWIIWVYIFSWPWVLWYDILKDYHHIIFIPCLFLHVKNTNKSVKKSMGGFNFLHFLHVKIEINDPQFLSSEKLREYDIWYT